MPRIITRTEWGAQPPRSRYAIATPTPELWLSHPPERMSGPGAASTAPDLAETCDGGPDVAKRTCSIDGCDRPYDSKGYCQLHGTRVRRYGDPFTVKRTVLRGAAEERFWARVDRTGDCWEWQGARHPLGYGNFNAGKQRDGRLRYVAAHRFSYELAHGPIPDGMEVCHACDNPPCVNPDHLWLGTHLDNMRDMDAKGRCDRWGNRK